MEWLASGYCCASAPGKMVDEAYREMQGHGSAADSTSQDILENDYTTTDIVLLYLLCLLAVPDLLNKLLLSP